MSLFAGSVYSSPGVLQAGIGGGSPPLPQENYSTLTVSTIVVANNTTVENPGKAIASANVSTLILTSSDPMTLSTTQLNATSIRGFGTPPVIAIPANITNLSGIVTQVISGVSSINAPLTFPTGTALTGILNMSVSSINGARPVTYNYDTVNSNSAVGFSTFSTVVQTMTLDPLSMYNVTYTAEIYGANLTSLGSNLNIDYPIFFTCESGVGTQYSSSGIRMVKDMCSGAASTFVVSDTFTMYPFPNGDPFQGVVRLGYGADVPYNADNQLDFRYNQIVVTKLGIPPPT